VNINHILTVLSAPDDCKELIRVLATEVQYQREAKMALVRELESERAAMLPVHNLLLEDKESMRIEAPEPGSSLDDLLRYAAVMRTEVRVTLAGVWEGTHDGIVEGVPEWDPYGNDDGSEDPIPWQIDGWYCGAHSANTPDERILSVELL
jgi:hypothetical protein